MDHLPPIPSFVLYYGQLPGAKTQIVIVRWARARHKFEIKACVLFFSATLRMSLPNEELRYLGSRPSRSSIDTMDFPHVKAYMI